MSGVAAEYFATDYADARLKFCAAAEAVGAAQEKFLCPAAGPNELALSIDVAVVGDADPNSALLIISATHGAEGYAGSAIQLGLLTTNFAGVLRTRQRVVLVHALNPFGYAHMRRTNEDNIDLNRNFVDHCAPYPENPDYNRLAEIVAPSRIGLAARIWAAAQMDMFRVTFGEGRFQSAITQGQYTHSDGLFYGGVAPAWSNLTLAKIVSSHIAGTKRVALIDIHTGLGPFGRGEFIMTAPPDSNAYRRARTWWGDHVRSTASHEGVSPDLSGAIEMGLARMLPNAELTAGSLEFGTQPMNDVMAALRDENWLWHHGSADHSRAARIRAAVRRAYYPDSDDWRNQVWQLGEKVTKRALAGLAGAL